MNEFSIVFLAALGLATAVHCWLALRQYHRVGERCGEVPTAFREQISLAAHQKAADYTRARVRVYLLDQVLGAVVLLIWTLGGGLALVDNWWRGMLENPLFGGVALILSVFIISGLLDLPLSAYRTFVLEQRFGFNRSSLGTFLVDTLKQTALLLLIGTPLVLAILWVMTHAGPYWWLYAWLLWSAFSLMLAWLYPAFIAPLFNRFTALEDEALKARLENLLERNGFSPNGIFVADGSRRSSHGNAFFSGFGAHKRIVLYDTLLGSLEPEETEAVLAHELGHFRRGHIRKQMALGLAFGLLAFSLLGWLIGQNWFYHGLGVPQPSLAMALVLFLFVSPSFSFFLSPLLAWFSRRHEYEADDFAARQTGAQPLIQALVKLYRDNANTLTPDALYSAFHETHPPAPLRIAHLEGKLE